MELRTQKTLSVEPPKRAYTSLSQAHIVERKKELGKQFNSAKVKAEFAKLSKSEIQKLENLIQADQDKYNEAIFHYQNTINQRGKQKYVAPANVPPKPKKPSGSFFRFLHDYRDKYVAKHPELPYQKVVNILSEDFNNLPKNELKVYEDAAKKDLETYLSEIKRWNEKYGHTISDKKSKKHTKSGSKSRKSSGSKTKDTTSKSKERTDSKGKERHASKSKDGNASKGKDRKPSKGKDRKPSKGKDGKTSKPEGRSSSKGKGPSNQSRSNSSNSDSKKKLEDDKSKDTLVSGDQSKNRGRSGSVKKDEKKNNEKTSKGRSKSTNKMEEMPAHKNENKRSVVRDESKSSSGSKTRSASKKIADDSKGKKKSKIGKDLAGKKANKK